EAGPQEGLVLGDHHPQELAPVLGRPVVHGSSIVTTVGPPSGLTTVIVPSKAASRRATPRSPLPPGSAPPRPSSPTARVSRSPARVPVTQARVARACLTTLVRHSVTAKYAADSTGSGRSSPMSSETVTGIGIDTASA